MAQIKQVDCFKKSIKLGELEPGALFSYKCTVAVKSEYCNNGILEYYILGSGEAFSPKCEDLRELSVLRVKSISFY